MLMQSVIRNVAPTALLGLFLSGCTIQPPVSSLPPAAAVPAASLPDSLHWFRDSAEQKAIYRETYLAATSAARTLSAGLPGRSWGVILDIDETILDNSDYQKQQALAGLGFTASTWNAWVMQRRATALPGAADFINSVRDDLDGQVILVSNRSQDQCGATEENLRSVGLKYDRILCDEVGDGNKNPRFERVVQGQPGIAAPLNVLIWVGDNIQDFPNLSQAAPSDLALFGKHYFALPNPMYGSWQKNPAR